MPVEITRTSTARPDKMTTTMTAHCGNPGGIAIMAVAFV
jgi:hypothetical protein